MERKNVEEDPQLEFGYFFKQTFTVELELIGELVEILTKRLRFIEIKMTNGRPRNVILEVKDWHALCSDLKDDISRLKQKIYDLLAHLNDLEKLTDRTIGM